MKSDKDPKSGEVPLIWKVHTPWLLEEIGNCCRDATVLVFPLRMLQSMLRGLAEYAADKDDPELNIHMLRLGLYGVPAAELDSAILGELDRLGKGREEWLTRLSKGA